ncbi:MAG TPA: inositol phosphate phosphatase SopB [Limnobacter sp.]|nr:inositol phosphate phosphatase SopB [Limnobacter sp.]
MPTLNLYKTALNHSAILATFRQITQLFNPSSLWSTRLHALFKPLFGMLQHLAPKVSAPNSEPAEEIFYDAQEDWSDEVSPPESPRAGISTLDAIHFKKLNIQASLKVLQSMEDSLQEHPELLNALKADLANKAQELDLQACAAPNTSPKEVKKTMGGKLKRAKSTDLLGAFNREKAQLVQAAQNGAGMPSNTKRMHFRTALAYSIHAKLSAKQAMALDPKTLDKKIFDAYIDILQKQPWSTIERTQQLLFQQSGAHQQAMGFYTRMTPASAMDPQLTMRYQASGINGVSSYANQEARHAVNLWRTEFSPVNPPPNAPIYSFSGLRHGIHDAYGLKTAPAARQQANDNRVKEWLHAALLDHMARHGLSVEDLNNAQTIDLPIVSVNLVTTAGHEERMATQQQAAYNRVHGQTITLSLLDASGQERQVQVKPKIFGFNTPVNAWALGPMGQLLGIWKKADAQNKAALEDLIGCTTPGSPVGGELGRLLPGVSNPAKAATICALVEQIRAIYSDSLHQSIGNEPYKLPVRLLALANECGLTPAFNCKSGKDRTGQLNVEIRDFYADLQAHQGAPRAVNAPREDLARKNYQTLFLEGGDREIQALNTGVAGSKSQLPYYDKLMGVKPGSVNNIKGISAWVGT